MTTLVTLHGFTGAPASFDAMLESFGAARVVRPLLAGHGPEPSMARSWHAEIERLAALVRGATSERAHLVGYSLGGRVGLALLDRAPELFARATIVGAHPGLASEAEREARRRDDRRWIELLETRGLDAFVDAWEAQPLFASQAEAMKSRARRIRRTHTARGLAHALRVLGLAEMPRTDPSRLRVPVTFVTGALDTKFTALAAACSVERHVIVPDAGHDVLLERPGALAAIVRGES